MKKAYLNTMKSLPKNMGGDPKNWTQDIRRQYNADYMDYWDAHSG